MNPELSLYIHVPFCRRKCAYCSFTSYGSREGDIPLYVRALKSEITGQAGNGILKSIYFGGGTPSLLSIEQFADILTVIKNSFALDKTAEITTEANPGTVNREYLASLRRLGINRLSLGIQSLDDDELRMLGRIHTAEKAGESVRFARSAGFDNVNLDLIYGLPGQSLGNWQHVLDEALMLAPEHLSLYSLTLEEETPMEQAIKEKLLPDIDPDIVARQYELAEDTLSHCGYRHYEISNWAGDGKECRHNITYWQNRPYLGLGVAAHSWLGNHRTANTDSLDEYLAAYAGGMPLTPSMDEEISLELEIAETVILGLRLVEGISINEVNNRFEINLLTKYEHTIEEMAASGLLEIINGRLALTPGGRLLSNEVFWRLLPDAAGV
jgi:oxygen-independent coproporphyrinogen-3 oxidase